MSVRKTNEIRKIGLDLTIRSDVSVSSKQRISPFFLGKLVALKIWRVNSFALTTTIMIMRPYSYGSVDPVEVVKYSFTSA